MQESRKELADLFNREMNQWQNEILAKIETPEDRKQRIRERAYALKEAREAERLQVVREKYDQRWKDANDDARTLDSKALTKFMSQERLRQIEEKRLRKQQLSSEENDFLDEWNRQLDAIAERDRQKLERLRNADIKMKHDLKNQVS